MLKHLFIALTVATSMASTGCGDSCAELAEICERCPDTPIGQIAKESCMQAVATSDDHTCETLVDDDHYAAFSCE